jgi:hypothetical protein
MLRILCLLPDEQTTVLLLGLLLQRGADVEARGGPSSDTVLYVRKRTNDCLNPPTPSGSMHRTNFRHLHLSVNHSESSIL